MPVVNLPLLDDGNGSPYTFIVGTLDNNDSLVINTQPGEFIERPGVGSISSLTSNVSGASVTLQGSDLQFATRWYITAINGLWT